jgi:integrase
MAKLRYNSKLKQYFLDWHEDGSRKRVLTGTDEKHGKRELKKLDARLLMKKMGFSGSPALSDSNADAKKSTIDIDTAINKYLEYSNTHHSPKNYECTAYILNGAFRSFLKHKSVRFIGQITAELVENYKALRLKGELKSRQFKRIKPSTVNRQVNTLKPMFKKLAEWGYIQTNPLEKVANLKQMEEEAGRCLSQTECQTLLNASKQCNGGSFYYLIATALGTGLRKSELKNLKVEDFVPEQQEIKVINRGQGARTKTGKNRIVDLSPALVKILLQHKPRGEYLFDFTNFRRNWTKTKKATGIVCRFHDLRHTFITVCLQNGIQPTSVADWVGHSDLRMIMKIYKHLERHHLKKEIGKLNGLLDEP